MPPGMMHPGMQQGQQPGMPPMSQGASIKIKLSMIIYMKVQLAFPEMTNDSSLLVALAVLVALEVLSAPGVLEVP